MNSRESSESAIGWRCESRRGEGNGEGNGENRSEYIALHMPQ